MCHDGNRFITPDDKTAEGIRKHMLESFEKTGNNPITETVEKVITERREYKDKMIGEGTKDHPMVQDEWQLNVRLKEDVAKTGVKEWAPLCHGIEYLIENLAVSSDGKILVDVYLPETMGLIREKVDINVFDILQNNDKYVWNIYNVDVSESCYNPIPIIVEAYYCVVIPGKSDKFSNMGGNRSMIIMDGSSIYMNINGELFAIKNGDYIKENEVYKKFDQELSRNIRQMSPLPYNAPSMQGYRDMSPYNAMGMGGYYGAPMTPPSMMPPSAMYMQAANYSHIKDVVNKHSSAMNSVNSGISFEEDIDTSNDSPE